MKLATLAVIATVALPFAAYADSSQPNSTPGLEGRPVTNQGEGTTGMNNGAYPGTSTSRIMGAETVDDVTTRRDRVRGSTTRFMNQNEPMGGRR